MISSPAVSARVLPDHFRHYTGQVRKRFAGLREFSRSTVTLDEPLGFSMSSSLLHGEAYHSTTDLSTQEGMWPVLYRLVPCVSVITVDYRRTSFLEATAVLAADATSSS